MKRVATMLTTLTALVLVFAIPAAAGGTDRAPSGTEARLEPSQPATVIRATGVLRRGMTVYPYVTHRIFDVRAKRPYALTSTRSPALLERYVGKRVTVYGTRVLTFPRGFGPPLLDVFRIVPLAKSSSA